jgi:ABC-type transport system involved in multi-copper enzyme maturation permease subunit
MTFLPIVARELRIASRRRSTYWVRSGAALVVMFIGAWFFLVTQNQPPNQIAMGIFIILTAGAGLYCLFSGVRSTADCLSEEKREGTLGLLFLTDLKGYDVVFGKLVANSLSGFYGVLAVVPMLALPLLLGGVTPGEFWRMALVSLNALFFSLAAGICVSALCRSARNAMALTLLVILLFAALLPCARRRCPWLS